MSETMDKTKDWFPTTNVPAPEGEPVMTIVNDERGDRNKQVLVRRNRLWFTPDGSMYVYYTPTHWQPWTSEPPRLCVGMRATT